jgi:tyrosyl-tRNA synthetase
MFGKLMSLSDGLMMKYYELLTDEDIGKVKSDIDSGKLHPKEAKVNLAKLIVGYYHGKEAAQKQAEEFDRAFKDKGFPTDIATTEVSIDKDSASIVEFLTDLAKILPSRGEAKRKIQEGAVEVNGSRVSDGNLALQTGREYQVRVGRKFAKIFLKKY